MENIHIETDIIKLDSFLKWAGIASTGSEAKFLVSEGNIKVNGLVETQRGKKLKKGDIIELNSEKYIIC